MCCCRQYIFDQAERQFYEEILGHCNIVFGEQATQFVEAHHLIEWVVG